MARQAPALACTSIPVPRGFDFARTALSHGWYALAPFSYDKERGRLLRLLRLKDGTLVLCALAGRNGAVDMEIAAHARLGDRRLRETTDQIRNCLRVDEDFAPFHQEARKYPEFRWMARSGAGRLLRAPSAFEDVVKMICTTNCTWALTTLMVRNLVLIFGEPFNDSLHAFPTPESLAGSSERTLRKDVKAGYRSPYILELAEKVASRRLDVEAWRSSPKSTGELFEDMCTVKGLGPYAVGNIMKLMGRYDYLGLDSWVRSQFYTLHHGGRKVKDSTIERHYGKYGKWRGLFFWLEMTRRWHDDKFLL